MVANVRARFLSRINIEIRYKMWQVSQSAPGLRWKQWYFRIQNQLHSTW